MILEELKPRKALNKAFLKVKPNRTEIEVFKTNLITLLDRTNDTESEEFHKNLVSDFLKDTYYKQNHFINTKGRNDLVIHNGQNANSTVGVIIEAKKPTNKSEMITTKKLNVKAFQELVLYYLRERITNKNLEVKQLIATNINEWFIFDEHLFERLFAQNKVFVKQFENFEESKKKTDVFYKEIAEPFIADITSEIEFTYFNIQDYQNPLRNADKENDNSLIALFKLLSPEHLLKLPFTNDSNSLDKRFYSELLHIIGLTEIKEGSKKLIQRNKAGERNTGTILEDAIIQLDSLDKLSRLEKPNQFGNTQQEQLFSVALELSITWINRILFLKLLEAQLITYHKGDKSYSFLNLDKIKNYDDLNSLFFQVLARKYDERNDDVKKIFEKVPYLNSSLFEPTELEQVTLFISNLKYDKTIPLISSTVLKDKQGKKQTGNLNTLEYLFEFLNAYDFGSEGSEEIQEDNKTLITASVLGLIFEKINGYKDGSFFTPGFITMYMCRQTIRKAVIQKFNETKKWNCKDIEELYDKIEDRKEANQIVNSIKICDPAVGSGHFLVSALNEIIAVKNDLKILLDRDGKRLKEYQVEVVNDELSISDEDGYPFVYKPNNKESQRIQETLFHEKQTLIENCLFGVDINSNSVKICRLRLWIELLKNAYYKNTTELETLPNIDINIKCGNSLVSRFAVDADLKQALKNSKWTIDTYRIAVDTYRNAENTEQKREMERLIENIKSELRTEINKNDPKLAKLYKLNGEFTTLTTQKSIFGMSDKEKKEWNKNMEKKTQEIQKLKAEIEDIKSNKIFENAFEWRFEFPEMLNDEGDFVGFDVVIGNPPYISNKEMHKLQMQDIIRYINQNYISSKSGNYDLYVPFIELGLSILKTNSEITYILPNKLMIAKYSKTLLKLIESKYSFVSYTDFSNIKVFEDASVYPIVVKLSNLPKINEKQITQKISVVVSDNIEIIQTEPYDFLNHRLLSEKNSSEGVLLLKIENRDKIEEELVFSPGINGFQFTNYGKCIKEGRKENNSRRVIVTGTIDRYCILQKLVRYKGVDYKSPYIYNDPLIISPKKWELFSTPKIVIAGMTKVIEATLDEFGELAPGVSVYSIVGKVETLKYVLGVLNSKLINWYFRNRFDDKHLAGGYISMNTVLIQKIPICKSENPKQFIKIVDKILSIKKQNPSADTINLENQIDQLVYKLYDLTEEEIKIIEESVK
jgi:galactitol-specific phosphotransferase system IIB component